MRMLDNAGYRTGYIYRNPLVKHEVPKPKNDVEVPPAVSSLGYLLEEEEMYKQGYVLCYLCLCSNNNFINCFHLIVCFTAFGRREISAREEIVRDGSTHRTSIKRSKF